MSTKLIGKSLKANPALVAFALFIFAYYIYCILFDLDLAIIHRTLFDNMLLILFGFTSIPEVMITVFFLTFLCVIALLRKNRIFTARAYAISAALLLVFFAVNSVRYLNSAKTRYYDNERYTATAEFLQTKDNVLLIGIEDFDWVMFELDGYLGKGFNFITIDDLLSYASTDIADSNVEADSGDAVRIDLTGIVPEPFIYKNPVFPLGNIDYVVVAGRHATIVNAELVYSEEASPMYRVYNIEDSTLYVVR